MEELANLIGTDSSASQIADVIKNALFVKASERVESLRPVVANTMFNHDGSDTGEE